MLNILIADDELLARETLKLLLTQQPDIGHVYEAESGTKALELAVKHEPELVILDIEMPGMTGIEVARALPKACSVLFATAYNEFAVMAFEVNAVDYILKPFDDSRFSAAIAKARSRIESTLTADMGKVSEMIQQLISSQQTHYKKRLVIRDPGRIRLIDVAQIDFVTGAGNYVELNLRDGTKVLHRETMATLENQLDPLDFVRIHRSSIVRRSSISELRPNDKGDYSVILYSGEVLTLSRRNRNKLNELTC
ncbi:LytTR family DNA-binding domain-containing protein [Aestuariibacter sp. AA17]|uniref:LytTR family DNA-binding domain-containing protein n=1 Tax=Fluctibacter corallii TaxID=2984329 RepID=A0ABT3A7L2_9ALTE|nr:LytTR family DNA-binding domain-containing protein [Aestuariibacter sp. AA17]MCV2884666.1 LytTR family DNA-binding domain-containing protein [Aestuariibacter sp. AA17]